MAIIRLAEYQFFAFWWLSSYCCLKNREGLHDVVLARVVSSFSSLEIRDMMAIEGEEVCVMVMRVRESIKSLNS